MVLPTALSLLLYAPAAASVARTSAQQPHQAEYIDVADPNWHFSAYNWFDSTPWSRATTNPGALFKLGFRNSSAITVLINTTRLRGGPTWPTVKVAYSIDDQPWRFMLLGSENGTSARPIVQMQVPVPANPRHEATITQHDLVLKVWASVQLCDRWNGGGASAASAGAESASVAAACSSYFEVAGATLDPGGTTAPPSTLQPRRMLFFGDSITEGTNANYYDYFQGRCHTSGGEMVVNAAQASWGAVLADALKCEPSQAAFAGTGYVTQGSYRYGNVPPLLFPGNVTGSAWDKVDAAHSRLPALRQRPPEYVFSAHGNNDQVCSGAASNPCTMADLQASVAAWVGAIRIATSPATRIVVIVPFGGTFSGHNGTRDAIRAGFGDYQRGLATKDSQAYLVDLYPGAPPGLDGQGPSANSCFGVHPIADAHARLATMIALDLAAQGAVLPPPPYRL